jgi:hypothetical protein
VSAHDGNERPVPILDVLYPYAGPCAFCGFGDKRHRLADSLVEQYRAGDSVDLIVDAFEWPDAVNEKSITTLVAYAEESRRRRRHRWEVRAA